MRDLMAVTARPEIISLAGGLPDTSTFPAEDFAALMARVAVDASARALQYGPTEGLDEVKECIARVMAAEGMEVEIEDLLVTTGGQQVIDLVCKTLIDPGDVVVAEAPTYPGAVPVFVSYQADVVQIEMDEHGMRTDVLEAELERLDREGRVPKFIYTVPSFQNPAGVTLALERRRELVRIANERELLILEDNPYGLLRYSGEPLPTLYAIDGAEYVIYLGTFSKILSPGLRLGWAAAPRPVLDKLNLGKGGIDLCSSTLSQHFVATYFAERDWRAYLGTLVELYRRRRDVMLEALAEHLPPEATWTRARRRAVHLGAAAGLHRHDRPAGARATRERRVRAGPCRVPRRPRRLGDAAELLRRRRGRHPRGRAADRQGRARAGRALLDAHGAAARCAAGGGAGARERGRAAAARGMRVAVLKGGRSLERQVSLRSGARVEDALHRLGHEVVPIDVGADLVDRLRAVRPDVAFVALHGRGGEDGTVQELLELVGVPYTASGPSACIRCMDKVLAKHALQDAGLPTPEFYAFSQAAFEELGAGRALPAIEERLDFPIVVKPAGPGLGARDQVRATRRGRGRRDRRRLLLRHEGAARALRRGARPRGVGDRRAERAGGAAGRRGGPERGGLLRLRGPLRDRAHDVHVPGRHRGDATARAQELALAAYTTLGCAGFARVDLMLEEATGELFLLEANAIPGLTDTSLLPLAAEAAGVPFDDLIARIVELAVARVPA